MNTLAPILLFVFNRPDHTKSTLEALRNNTLASQSILYIYADAARNEADRDAVEKVREIIHNIEGFKQIEIIERKENWGLARNIIDGVTTQTNKHGRVIVLEDDLVTAPYFLQFMNDALDIYSNEPRVGHIYACEYTQEPTLPDTFLIKFTGSWGWATWDRAWKHFNPDGAYLLNELRRRNLTHTFDFNGTYPYTRMLQRQVEGKNNSWAIRWNASLFLNDILSLNVGKSLVRNIGLDGSGTHCGNDNLYSSVLYTQPLPVVKIEPIVESNIGRNSLTQYYRRTNSFWAKAMRRIKRMINL
ncbi:MAG: glycosyltransferase [Bacteroidales bacterium]|nr:glycosyltransferase [Bacteroidales bacterium]